jgi:hypothetical protein
MLKQISCLYYHHSLRKINTLYIFTLLLFVASGCISTHQPIERFDDKETQRKKDIEKHLQEEYGHTIYQSLAYSPLRVYKPESFKKLDSLYNLKDDYIERNDLRGLKISGIDEEIPAYRAEAQNDIDQVRYELRHIYSIHREGSFIITHTVFLYDHKDSLLSQDKLYSYTLPLKYREIHNAYLFEYHFITNRDLYISRDEQQFIRFYKNIEQQLSGTEQLEPFMLNTMKTMQLAQKVNSVDYRTLVKYKSIEHLKLLAEDITINEFGTLIAIEDKKNDIVAYEYLIKWQDNADKVEKKSTFIYSPTLTLREIDTTKE